MTPLDTHDVVVSTAVTITPSSRDASATPLDPRFAGALAFSPDGVLFVGEGGGREHHGHHRATPRGLPQSSAGRPLLP